MFAPMLETSTISATMNLGSVVQWLKCPADGGPLCLESNRLAGLACSHQYPVVDGTAVLLSQSMDNSSMAACRRYDETPFEYSNGKSAEDYEALMSPQIARLLAMLASGSLVVDVGSGPGGNSVL